MDINECEHNQCQNNSTCSGTFLFLKFVEMKPLKIFLNKQKLYNCYFCHSIKRATPIKMIHSSKKKDVCFREQLRRWSEEVHLPVSRWIPR